MNKKKPDLVVWNEEKGYYQRELEYGSDLGAPAIKIDNVHGWRKNQIDTINRYFEKKYNELRDEFQQLANEVTWNELIYSSEYNFIPIIGEIYHLYERENGTVFLSIIEPKSWDKKYLGSFKLDTREKWIKIV